jgi:hypothetical protein
MGLELHQDVLCLCGIYAFRVYWGKYARQSVAKSTNILE